MAYIKQEFIERIKDKTDIADVIGKFSDLKKKGKYLFCLSPFGVEKSPSCMVDTVKQRFKDFSTGMAGDVFTFLMEREHLTYPQAVEWLARHHGIDIEYENEEWAKEKEKRALKKESLRPLVMSAHRHYLKAFRDLPEDHPARKEIFEKRQYTQEEVVEWGIGYAPGGKFIADHIARIGKTKEAQEVFMVGEKGYDKYWDRVVYPIHDENGLLVGFAGRDVSGSIDAAKWINPSENPLYNKEKTWYALHKAKDAIRKAGEAWIVEGYNDVIGWHKGGIANTIAPCGTAITDRQIQILKRYCSKVIICMDGDKAGVKSAVKHIPMFFRAGFNVQVVVLPEGQDPDDYSRLVTEDLHVSLLPYNKNGFSVLLDHHVQGDEIQKSRGAKELVELVASLEDDAYHEIFLGWISKTAGLKRTKIDQWFRDASGKLNEEKEAVKWYLLPDEIKTDLKVLRPDIEKYGMFIDGNRIWMMTGEEKPYTFKDVSNFSIEIIQHMHDEKFPMKLVRIRNIVGEERIFDVMSDELNTPQAFDNAMTRHGNYLWTGGRNEFQRLRAFLFDRMGVGSKIEVLGWQPDNFWVWNNGITIPKTGTQPIDDNGCFKLKGTSYYIPSANKIYVNNPFKFEPQKKVVLVESVDTFTAYASMMMKVHRQHAITGILFTIASIFLDIIEDKLGNFPLLFLYGPASSGKDQLIDCCQSFFGRPQTPIHIGNKVSTAKAQVRKFAQFRNMVVHLSEYRPGDQQLDELLKGFWDRRGYERGTMDSAYGTEVVPVSSSVIFTGNHYPEDDALITRVICEEMTKTEFSMEEKQNYRILKDMNKKGFSSFTAKMLDHRELWADRFKEVFRKVETQMKADLEFLSSHDRMISNAAVLGAAYELMKDLVQFPFTFNQFVAHMKDGLERQVRKLNTASTVVKWWDCFLAAVRTKTDPLKHGREFEVKDNLLFFNFTHCYNRVMAQWWAQYHEQTPSKSKITDIIKKDNFFVEEKACHRMDERRSSAWVIDIQKMSIYGDLMDAIEWQKKDTPNVPPVDIEPATGQDKPKDDFPF